MDGTEARLWHWHRGGIGRVKGHCREDGTGTQLWRWHQGVALAESKAISVRRHSWHRPLGWSGAA